MKVLLITKNFPPLLGGASIVYEQLQRHFGPDLAILTAPTEKLPPSSIGPEMSVYRSRFLKPTDSITSTKFSKLRRSIRVHFWNRTGAAVHALKIAFKTKPQLVCIGSFSEYWLAGILRTLLRIPAVFYIHGEELTAPENSRFVGRRNFRALRKAEGVVAVSRFTQTKLTALGVPPDRIALIRNGVELSRFSLGSKDDGLLAKYGLRGKQVLLTVGRLDRRKGFETVLRALPEILRACPDVVYVVAGFSGDLPKSNLESLVGKLGIHKHVIFTGTIDEEKLPALYRSCDIFVMPNYTLSNGDTEGFGLVFLEAAACGKPAIGGHDGGVPDAIVDGETGILVDGASVEQFTHAALRLLRDAELSKRLGTKARLRSEAMGWQTAAEHFREFCCTVVRRNRALL